MYEFGLLFHCIARLIYSQGKGNLVLGKDKEASLFSLTLPLIHRELTNSYKSATARERSDWIRVWCCNTSDSLPSFAVEFLVNQTDATLQCSFFHPIRLRSGRKRGEKFGAQGGAFQSPCALLDKLTSRAGEGWAPDGCHKRPFFGNSVVCTYAPASHMPLT